MPNFHRKGDVSVPPALDYLLQITVSGGGEEVSRVERQVAAKEVAFVTATTERGCPRSNVHIQDAA